MGWLLYNVRLKASKILDYSVILRENFKYVKNTHMFLFDGVRLNIY